MKTVASLRVLFVLIIPVWVCQCSGNYNLVDYKEYRFGELDDHISYNYNEAGELKSKTRFRSYHRIDSWVPIQKTQFELDDQGRIISRYNLDPDETDSIRY